MTSVSSNFILRMDLIEVEEIGGRLMGHPHTYY